jgi:hypothetical protein
MRKQRFIVEYEDEGLGSYPKLQDHIIKYMAEEGIVGKVSTRTDTKNIKPLGLDWWKETVYPQITKLEIVQSKDMVL